MSKDNTQNSAHGYSEGADIAKQVAADTKAILEKHSQKRRPGYYWVNKKGTWAIAEYAPLVTEMDGDGWYQTGSRLVVSDNHWTEIDERPIERGEVERLREYITAEREISQRFTDENSRLRRENERLKAERTKVLEILDTWSC